MVSMHRQESWRDSKILHPLPDLLPWTKPARICTTLLPEGPWTDRAIDFAHQFLQVILSWLDDAIFTRQGIPKKIKTGNGPPFQGQEFKDFVSQLGIHHRRITPLWPETMVNKHVRSSSTASDNWRAHLPWLLTNILLSSISIPFSGCVSVWKQKINNVFLTFNSFSHLPKKAPKHINVQLKWTYYFVQMCNVNVLTLQQKCINEILICGLE